MIAAGTRIYVASRTVDFRGSFDRLSGLVREQLALDPRSGAFFVFLNRSGDRLKVLFFDGTGDCLLYKRLDRGTFRGIVSVDATSERVEIDAAKLRELLSGLAPPSRRLH